jgi:hypothetical protein
VVLADAHLLLLVAQPAHLSLQALDHLAELRNMMLEPLLTLKQLVERFLKSFVPAGHLSRFSFQSLGSLQQSPGFPLVPGPGEFLCTLPQVARLAAHALRTGSALPALAGFRHLPQVMLQLTGSMAHLLRQLGHVLLFQCAGDLVEPMQPSLEVFCTFAMLGPFGVTTLLLHLMAQVHRPLAKLGGLALLAQLFELLGLPQNALDALLERTLTLAGGRTHRADHHKRKTKRRHHT